jgi:hypothetical protein
MIVDIWSPLNATDASALQVDSLNATDGRTDGVTDGRTDGRTAKGKGGRGGVSH